MNGKINFKSNVSSSEQFTCIITQNWKQIIQDNLYDFVLYTLIQMWFPVLYICGNISLINRKLFIRLNPPFLPLAECLVKLVLSIYWLKFPKFLSLTHSLSSSIQLCMQYWRVCFKVEWETLRATAFKHGPLLNFSKFHTAGSIVTWQEIS